MHVVYKFFKLLCSVLGCGTHYKGYLAPSWNPTVSLTLRHPVPANYTPRTKVDRVSVRSMGTNHAHDAGAFLRFCIRRPSCVWFPWTRARAEYPPRYHLNSLIDPHMVKFLCLLRTYDYKNYMKLTKTIYLQTYL